MVDTEANSKNITRLEDPVADKTEKYSDNIEGKYYVDSSCIACDACATVAPDNFLIDEDDGHAYVKKQPENQEEEEFCKEALEGCPVEAIGDDGVEEAGPQENAQP